MDHSSQLVLASLVGLLAGALPLAWRLRRLVLECHSLHYALMNLPGAYVLWGADDRLVASNEAYRQLHPQAFRDLGHRPRYVDFMRYSLACDLTPEQEAAALADRMQGHRRDDRLAHERLFPGNKWMRVTKMTLPDGRVFTIALDVTALRRRGLELDQAQRVANLGTWRLAEDDTLHLGGVVAQLHGLAAEADPRTLDDLLRRADPGDRASLLAAVAASRSGREGFEAEYRVVDPKGRPRSLSVTVRPDRPEDGVGTDIFAVVQDTTERRRHEAQLRHLAYYDPLTGLANRALFQREVRRGLREIAESGGQAALILLDLDHFKEVNDTLGHTVGDDLLVALAKIMMGCVRPRDMLARLGGDEFALFLPDVKDAGDVILVIERLRAATLEPVHLDGVELWVKLSIGAAIGPGDGHDLETLSRNADLALYRVKAEGRDGYCFFDAEMYETTRDRLSLTQDLRAALEGDLLELHYQPQVCLRRRVVTGCEALLRWTHPTRGAVPPSTFIPVAESSSLIGELGVWVLRRACREAARFMAGRPDLRVSVNVSATQFWQMDMVAEVEAALAESGLEPSQLCLELTESLLVDRSRLRAIESIAELDRMGVRMAIDDFGTGYSSLAYLRDLPFDELKIDRGFVAGCDSDPTKRALLEGMVGLGHGLGLKLVAEGVETEAEVETLQALRCDGVQGYRFGRPVPPRLLPALIETAEHDLQGLEARELVSG
ncbi:MAG: EAL domain-containing protein [Geminicoccaceae bacterium]|nr:EAL domain-containing protein [Geminicoccaceae bacterium]